VAGNRAFASSQHLAPASNTGNDPAGRAGSEAVDWLEASWNPTAGCSPYSPGCDNCYAMRIAARLARMDGKTGARYAGLTVIERTGPHWVGEIRVTEDLLTWPLYQRRSRRIAVDAMSDLFHERLPTATVDLLHAVMTAARWHHFLVLTKRAARMRAYYSDPQTPGRIIESFEFLLSIAASYMRVRLSTTFLRSVLRSWVGEEQRSPWGPGRFCIAASAAASPYMRSGPTGGPHHNASCTRRCPGETRPT
jgi:hypothetical protein